MAFFSEYTQLMKMIYLLSGTILVLSTNWYNLLLFLKAHFLEKDKTFGNKSRSFLMWVCCFLKVPNRRAQSFPPTSIYAWCVLIVAIVCACEGFQTTTKAVLSEMCYAAISHSTSFLSQDECPSAWTHVRRVNKRCWGFIKVSE